MTVYCTLSPLTLDRVLYLLCCLGVGITMIQEAEETPATLSLLENLSQAVLSPTTTPTRPNRPRRAAAKMTPRPERGGGVWDRTRAQRIARVAGWLVLGHSFATGSPLYVYTEQHSRRSFLAKSEQRVSLPATRSCRSQCNPQSKTHLRSVGHTFRPC